jgi:N-acetyl sugar amidotransferase
MNQPQQPYKICTFCVLDSRLEMLQFDANGQCDACKLALSRMPHEWLRGEAGAAKLNELAIRLKREGQGKPYDAMIGLSGGVDSAYLAHLAVKQMGLRVLAVHVDGGWNTEAAVRNIESLVRELDIDLFTEVIEWQEMRDLQLAFLKSSVFNQDIPQDHAFFATLYRTASKFGLRNFLSGVNFASEGVNVTGLGHPALDGHHVLEIHKRFGTKQLKTFPIMKLSELLWMTRVRKQLTIHKPLDYIDYNKKFAIRELNELYGWMDYGNKHCESRFTKFYQEIVLPEKFHFDKRPFHLSSLIVAGQLDRETGIKELEKSIIEPMQRRRDIRFIAKKLEIAEETLLDLLAQSPVSHTTYPNRQAMFRMLISARRQLSRLFKATSEIKGVR